MAAPFMATGGPVYIKTDGSERISISAQGIRYYDFESGRGFFKKHNGEISTISDGLICDCGSEFTVYVRQHLEPFPYHRTSVASREVTDLWPNRKLKMQKTKNGDWKMARVVCFDESITDPLSDCTFWGVPIKFEENDNDGDEDVVYFGIDKVTVNEGGTLENRVPGWQQEIPFVWLEPAQPALMEVEGACYHGSSEDNFAGKHFQRIIEEYLKDTIDDYLESLKQQRETGGQILETVSEKVQDIVRDHPDLITEDFCQHLYAWCLQEYLWEGRLSGVMIRTAGQKSTVATSCLLELANNLRYRYLPKEANEKNIRKISKYARDVHTERGLARILTKEVDCPCARSIHTKSERMDKVGICFGCKKDFHRSKLRLCNKCLFAKYCCRECQVNDWPEHKAPCKAVRKELRATCTT